MGLFVFNSGIFSFFEIVMTGYDVLGDDSQMILFSIFMLVL